MQPAVLQCPACQTRVEGRFGPGNEFAALSPDELHFLRVFVHCEGSIREMEAALGVSYPTVKARLSALKQALSVPVIEAATSQSAPSSTDSRIADVMADLRAGRISAAQAAKLIRDARNQ